MFSKIVVGVDGSERGRDALALARTLVDATHAEVVLVHVYPRLAGPSLRETAQQLIDHEAVHGPADAATMVVADVSVAHALHRVAEAEEADVLVVGSTRHGPVGRILLGDIARQTIHHAPCAVAVAPRGFAEHPAALRRIGVGFDGSTQAQSALDTAAGLARATHGRLRLLDAVAPPFQGPTDYAYPYPIDWTDYYEHAKADAQRLVDRALQEIDVPAAAEVREGQPVEALVGLSDECDVVLVGSRHWGTLSRVVLGSTADGLASRAHCPVVVMPMSAATGNGGSAPAVAHPG